jgi:hypothetical protein
MASSTGEVTTSYGSWSAARAASTVGSTTSATLRLGTVVNSASSRGTAEFVNVTLRAYVYVTSSVVVSTAAEHGDGLVSFGQRGQYGDVVQEAALVAHLPHRCWRSPGHGNPRGLRGSGC